MAYRLISQTYKQVYYGPYYSFSFLIVLLLRLSMVFLPFFLHFHYQYMFQLQTFFYDQPNFIFNNELLIQVNQNSQIQQFNTISDFSNSRENDIEQLKLSANLIDVNNDGVPDLFQSNITFKSVPSQIQQIDLLFLFNVRLQKIIKYDLNGLSHIRLYSGIQRAQIFGDISVAQKSSLYLSPYTNTIFNQSITKNEAAQPVNDIEQIILNNNNRNLSIITYYNTFNQRQTQQQQTEISINLKINTQKIKYIGKLTDQLNVVWVRYFAYLLPLYFFTNFILETILSNRYFDSYTLNNLPRNHPIH